MFEFHTRTRYSEYDEHGRMRLSSLLDYLQNTSSYHSFDSGMSVEYYRRIHKAWLINYWDIYIDALPTDSAYVTMGTSPHDVKGLFAYRNFWLKDSSTDVYYIKADSVWFLVDTDNMRPIKPTPDDLAPFGEYTDVLGLKTDTRKVRFDNADNFTHIADIAVTPALLDTNHHVNNIRYISTAFEAMSERGFIDYMLYPKRIRVEYKHAATLGDTLVISARRTAANNNDGNTAKHNDTKDNDDTMSKIIAANAVQLNASHSHSNTGSASKGIIQTAICGTDGTEYCNIEFFF